MEYFRMMQGGEYKATETVKDPLSPSTYVKIVQPFNSFNRIQKDILEQRILHILEHTDQQHPMRWSEIPKLVKKTVDSDNKFNPKEWDSEYTSNVTDQLLLDLERKRVIRKSVDSYHYWIKD